VVVEHGVTIVGYHDLSNHMAAVASELYGTNLWHILDELGGAEEFEIDLENDIIRPSLVLYQGEVTWPPPKPTEAKPVADKAAEDKPEAKPAAAKAAEVRVPPEEDVEDVKLEPAKPRPGMALGTMIIGALALALAGGWVYLRLSAGADQMEPQTFIFLQHLTVFVLSCFIGWQVVWNVTAALHTPLMSVTNAISGIIIVGGILQAYDSEISAPLIIGAIATLFAMINIVGGFFVTQRMLRMFRK
jgi:NAD(P) transhydrogenase subunit alpha